MTPQDLRDKFIEFMAEQAETPINDDERLILDMFIPWFLSEVRAIAPPPSDYAQIWPPTGAKVVFEDDESTMEFNDEGIVLRQKGQGLSQPKGSEFKLPEGVFFTGVVVDDREPALECCFGCLRALEPGQNCRHCHG